MANFITTNQLELKIAFSLTVVSLVFIMIGHVYPDKIQSKLKNVLFTLPQTDIDWWSVSHFVYFGILGYLFPNYLFELFIIGILWEVIEDGLTDSNKKQLLDCNKEYNGATKHFKHLWCKVFARDGDYWYGKWDDIFANLLGMVVGAFIRKYVKY
jgi:hypothetical protein